MTAPIIPSFKTVSRSIPNRSVGWYSISTQARNAIAPEFSIA